MPIYLQEANANLGIRKGTLPDVEKLCDEVIALPMYPELDAGTQDIIIEAINGFGDEHP
jgi:dTDP-4-amino-4,6-dideoxygalactose transaminase